MPSRFGFETNDEAARQREHLQAVGRAKANDIDSTIKSILEDLKQSKQLPGRILGGPATSAAFTSGSNHVTFGLWKLERVADYDGDDNIAVRVALEGRAGEGLYCYSLTINDAGLELGTQGKVEAAIRSETGIAKGLHRTDAN